MCDKVSKKSSVGAGVIFAGCDFNLFLFSISFLLHVCSVEVDFIKNLFNV